MTENTLRRRKKTASASSSGDDDAVQEAVQEFTRKHPPHPHPERTLLTATTTTPQLPSVFSWFWLLLHSVCCGIFIAGWILQQYLHTSVECEMTYSQRQLIPIPQSSPHPTYTLHKFIDQRDPRPHHRAMLDEWLPIVQETQDEELLATQVYLDKKQKLPTNPPFDHHCSSAYSSSAKTNDTVVVLYIPGHWGSYMQSRSIGAHGIQLTGARDFQQAKRVTQALSPPTTTTSTTESSWKGTTARSLSEFQFDVYAVNFQEEGAALHAQFLWEQTTFVAQVVSELVNTCKLSQVVLLGHSMGGYVARLTPMIYPETKPYIANVVTLGSPHAHPVFGWESTIHELHQAYLVKDTSEDAVLVAISGGLRDEMIPPVACEATHGLSILSPEIMQLGPNGAQPIFGMDHRAIVWCHNLLSVLRKVIYTLVREENQKLSPTSRLQVVQASLGLKDSNYRRALEKHQTKFRERNGLVSTIAMESAMLYHLELLVGLFAVLGCFHTIGARFMGNDMSAIKILTTIYLASRSNYQIQLVSIAVLAFVADGIHLVLQWIMGLVMAFLLKQGAMMRLSRRLKQIRLLALGIFLVVLGFFCIGKVFSWQVRLILSFLVAIYFLTIATAIAVAAFERQPPKIIPFAVTFFLICPFLVAGKIMALLSEVTSSNLPPEYSPERGLLLLMAKLFLPIVLQLLYYHSIESRRDDLDENMRGFIMTPIILYFGLSLFEIGEGYRAGGLLSLVAWLECFFLPIL